MPQRTSSPVACLCRTQPAPSAECVPGQLTLSTMSMWSPACVDLADNAALNTSWLTPYVFSVRSHATSISIRRQTLSPSLLAAIGKSREVSG